jgi:hypothetical protein
MGLAGIIVREHIKNRRFHAGMEDSGETQLPKRSGVGTNDGERRAWKGQVVKNVCLHQTWYDARV